MLGFPSEVRCIGCSCLALLGTVDACCTGVVRHFTLSPLEGVINVMIPFLQMEKWRLRERQ